MARKDRTSSYVLELKMKTTAYDRKLNYQGRKIKKINTADSQSKPVQSCD